MVEVNIYSLNEVDKESRESANYLESNWYGPNIPSWVKDKIFWKKTNKAIIKKGKQLAKDKKILRDISAVITSNNFSAIGFYPHNYVTVDFYTFLVPKMRNLNPEL